MITENKISVVVPVYNLEKYVVRTLESICKQTYKNLEIIVVDDGSDDDSWNVINSYARSDDRIKCLHQDNAGVTAARLNGINHSTGKWIGFVDADDEIDEDMFEMLINNACKYNADIAHCGYKMLFGDGRVNYFYNTGKIVEQDTVKGIEDLLNGNMIEPGIWNKLYKKDIVEKADLNNRMDLSIKINEDLLMNYLLFENSENSVFIDECKYSYVVRTGSASRKKINKNKIYDPIKVRRIILDSANDKIKPLAQKTYLSVCINVYSKLSNSAYAQQEDLNNVRNIIKMCKPYSKLLEKKQRIMYEIILFSPKLYKQIYRFYSKHFKINKYC